MDVLAHLGGGLGSIFNSPLTLALCLLGVTIGTLVSAMPGIGTVTAMAVLLPITYGIDPSSALVFLTSIYLGGMYGGRISSILLNIPGDASAVVSTFDGHPLSKQGRTGYALTLSAVASFVGGLIGFVGLALLSGMLARAAIYFGPAEYFTLVVFVLLATSGVADASPLRSVISVALGLLIATVGVDPISGAERFTWGVTDLYDGIDLIVLAIGIFGISEVLVRVAGTGLPSVKSEVGFRSLFPPVRDVTRFLPSMLRGGSLGFGVGILPGAGASMATFVAYSAERSMAKDTTRFGKGDPRGLAAPEAADNASVGGALIPTLSLGIPGSAAGALILGGLVIAGLQPGPLLMQTSPTLVWTVIASVLVANVLLLLMNTVMVPAFTYSLQKAEPYLTAVIGCLCLIGVYSVRASAFDVGLAMMFGILGFAMRTNGFPLAGLLLGLILGPMLEQNLRQVLISSGGDAASLVGSPLSIGFALLSLAVIMSMVVRTVRQLRGSTMRRVADERDHRA